MVSRRTDAQVIERPRFIGLYEFGPRNTIYHEGQKYRVQSCILPASGRETLFAAARLCHVCGYVHHHEHVHVDLCEHCKTRLDASNSLYASTFLSQPAVRLARAGRISSNEEERARTAYRLTTHYRFAPNGDATEATVRSSDGTALLEVRYAPQTELWRGQSGLAALTQPGLHHGAADRPLDEPPGG